MHFIAWIVSAWAIGSSLTLGFDLSLAVGGRGKSFCQIWSPAMLSGSTREWKVHSSQLAFLRDGPVPGPEQMVERQRGWHEQVSTLKLLLARRIPPQMAESGTGQLELYVSVCATEKRKDVQVCQMLWWRCTCRNVEAPACGLALSLTGGLLLSSILSVIHWTNTFCIHAAYVLDIVLGAGDTVMNKTRLLFPWSWRSSEGKTISKENNGGEWKVL